MALLPARCDRAPSARPACGRTTVALNPGTLRQPSSSSCMPSRSTNSGFTSTMSAVGSRPTEMSTTKIRSGTPTCGAASPIPGAAYMVSIMSSMSRSIVRRDRVNRLGAIVEDGVAAFEDGSDHLVTMSHAERAELAEASYSGKLLTTRLIPSAVNHVTLKFNSNPTLHPDSRSTIAAGRRGHVQCARGISPRNDHCVLHTQVDPGKPQSM